MTQQIEHISFGAAPDLVLVVACCKCAQNFERTAAQALRRETRCKECRRNYNARYNSTPQARAMYLRLNKERKRTETEKIKNKARKSVYNAIRRGALVRQPCEVCGSEKVEAHHTDYSEPRKIRWLCRLHHKAVHLALKG